MKKGSKAGTTELTQSINPFLAASKLSFEKMTKQIVNKTNKAGIKFFRIF